MSARLNAAPGRLALALLLGLGALAVTAWPLALEPRLAYSAPAAESYQSDFTAETVGADPSSFIPLVGFWSIGVDGDRKVLLEDGNRWDLASASKSAVEQAQTLYGERYAEFLDNVQAYSFFPFAIARGVDNFSQGQISVRVKPVDGRIDQAGGIIFDVKPNGDYLILRLNAVENNLVLFQYIQGERTVLKWIRNVPTSSLQWHDLKLVVNGDTVNGYMDGALLLQHTLEDPWLPVSGQVGIWSKADSVVAFDDFRVEGN